MSTLRNKVTLVGRLGATPELQTVADKYKLSKFSIATNERSKNKNGEWVDNTQWHNIVAWGKTAENLSKFGAKGNEIMIEGKLVNHSYETKSGEKRFVTEIEASEFLLITPKSADVKPEKSSK